MNWPRATLKANNLTNIFFWFYIFIGDIGLTRNRDLITRLNTNTNILGFRVTQHPPSVTGFTVNKCSTYDASLKYLNI